MNDALVVLNPRTIPECMRAFEELPIPKIYLRGFTEKEVEVKAFPEILGLGYDWLWVVSDDAIVRPSALNAVRALARAGHPAVTGYSQRTHTEWVVNLTKGPIVPGGNGWPEPASYDFYEFRDVVSWPTPELRTWFTGMSLTGMRTDLWRQFPFACFGEPGCASDFSLSMRLQQADVPILAAREAFCYHWRNEWMSTNHVGDQSPVHVNKRIVMPVNVADCDNYRRQYDTMSFADHQAFYARVASDYPDQSYGSVSLMQLFLAGCDAKTIVEIGGWDGSCAAQLLRLRPTLESWVNYEIAKVQHVCNDPRYRGVTLTDWLWKSGPVQADAFIASHVLEHLSLEHLEALLGVLDCRYAYVDVPLFDQPFDWMAGLTTHKLPLSIHEFDALLERYGWVIGQKHQRVGEIPSHVRFLER
jgi:hypothetical protein